MGKGPVFVYNLAIPASYSISMLENTLRPIFVSYYITSTPIRRGPQPHNHLLGENVYFCPEPYANEGFTSRMSYKVSMDVLFD